MAPYKEERFPDGSFDTGLFAHKFKGPGLNYEIVLGIYTGQICRVVGPYKAGAMPDLKVSKEEGLVAKLRRHKEKCVGDGTYRNAVFINSGPGLPRELLDLIKVVKARHETVNSRMKRCALFTCNRAFRHDIEVHGISFHAITNLVEIEIETESPLFSITQQVNKFDSYYRRYVRRHRGGRR
jgi:hypothetical protein